MRTITLILGFIFLFSSCFRGGTDCEGPPSAYCVNKSIGYSKLNDSTKKWIPSVNDSAITMNDSSHTIKHVFKLNSKTLKDRFYVISSFTVSDKCGNSNYCDNGITIQEEDASYSSTTLPITCSILRTKYINPSLGLSTDLINSPDVLYFNLYSNNVNYYFNLLPLDTVVHRNLKYLAAGVIGGKQYSDLYELYTFNTFSTKGITYDKFYYSLYFGFIGFTLTDGSLWIK